MAAVGSVDADVARLDQPAVDLGVAAHHVLQTSGDTAIAARCPRPPEELTGPRPDQGCSRSAPGGEEGGEQVRGIGDDTADALTPLISHSWSLATALSLLAWFVFAPQCLSTLATVTPACLVMETGSKMPVDIFSSPSLPSSR